MTGSATALDRIRAALAPAYEVERIHKHRGSPSQLSYLVLWKGYPIEEATWVDETAFLDTQVVRDYWKAKADAKAAKPAKPARK